MNPTIPHELNPLPVGIETQLATLQDRHRVHQEMLADHHEQKHERRKRHREGWHKAKYTAHTLR